MNFTSINKNSVQKIILSLYSESPVYISRLESKDKDKLYKAVMKSDKYFIVRISENSESINYFLKAQWCSKHVREHGILTPEVLEVGNTIIPFPYMISNEIYGIPGEKYEGNREPMFVRLGEICKEINSINTEGYGENFNWSKNLLTKRESWQDYLQKELKIDEIAAFYEEKNFLNDGALKIVQQSIENIKKWNFEPTLAHGDLLPKNTIVNKEGEIIGIIDWKSAKSQNAIYWDLATTLNSIGSPEREKFVEGYGIKKDELDNMMNEINTIYVLKKSDIVKEYMGHKSKSKDLDFLRNKFASLFK